MNERVLPVEFTGQSLVHAGQQMAQAVFAEHLLPTSWCDCGGLDELRTYEAQSLPSRS